MTITTVMTSTSALTLQLVASARDQLKGIHRKFSTWDDPLSCQLHAWCEKVLDNKVSDRLLSDEAWVRAGKKELSELFCEILVNSVDCAPLSRPMYLRESGAMLEPWMVTEMDSLFGCYPLDGGPCLADPHLFAEEMLRWAAPFCSFCETSSSSRLLPLTAFELRDPETRKSRAVLLVHLLLKTQKDIMEKESQRALDEMEGALVAENEALLLYIETELARVTLAKDKAVEDLERRVGLIDAVHKTDRALLTVRVDCAEEKVEHLTQDLKESKASIEKQQQEIEALHRELNAQRRRCEEIQNSVKKGRRGCQIM